MISSLHAYLKAFSKLSIHHLFLFFKMRSYHPNLLKVNLTLDLPKTHLGNIHVLKLTVLTGDTVYLHQDTTMYQVIIYFIFQRRRKDGRLVGQISA